MKTPPAPMVTHTVSTPLGPLRLGATPQGLAAAGWVEDSTGEAWWTSRVGPSQGLPSPEATAVLEGAIAWLEVYFRKEFNHLPQVSLNVSGTAHQSRVWEELVRIPPGASLSYGELARRLGGGPEHARAAGGAVGANPVSLWIPCHRVRGRKGELTGYLWGVERKAWLLHHEGGRLFPHS